MYYLMVLYRETPRTINDLLNDEGFFKYVLLLFWGFFICGSVTAIIVSVRRKKAIDNIYGDDNSWAAIEEKKAKIVARRTVPLNPVDQKLMVNMVVFELENKSRIELAIKDPNIYGIMVEGDCGMLKYQGKKFIEFKREDISQLPVNNTGIPTGQSNHQNTGHWYCPVCGKKNENYVGTCGCGQKKP